MSQNKFIYHVLDFNCLSCESIQMNNFKGSALRGAFGNAFKKLVCNMDWDDCRSCVLSSDCPYAYIFMGIVDKENQLRSATVNMPVPYVIDPPDSINSYIKKGEQFKFSMTIFGKACEYNGFIISSVEKMGVCGLGKNKGQFVVQSVNCGLSNETIFIKDNMCLNKIMEKSLITFESSYVAKKIELEFKTPFKASHNGKLVSSVDFEVIMRNILRRLQLMLFYHYKIDARLKFDKIIESSKKIQTIKDNLKVYDWVRVSGRTGNKIPMSGYVGKISFAGELTPFMSLLRAGEILHIGKGCSLGMGKYSLIM
ncbi:UNVERIFIED_CONTAM: uncharacterized protein DUF2276 [Acetivibrio alkalicellulosi]